MNKFFQFPQEHLSILYSHIWLHKVSSKKIWAFLGIIFLINFKNYIFFPLIIGVFQIWQIATSVFPGTICMMVVKIGTFKLWVFALLLQFGRFSLELCFIYYIFEPLTWKYVQSSLKWYHISIFWQN